MIWLLTEESLLIRSVLTPWVEQVFNDSDKRERGLKVGTVVQACNSRAQVVKAGGLGVQAHLQPHRKLESCQYCIRLPIQERRKVKELEGSCGSMTITFHAKVSSAKTESHAAIQLTYESKPLLKALGSGVLRL